MEFQFVPPLVVLRTVPLLEAKPTLLLRKNTDHKSFVVPEICGVQVPWEKEQVLVARNKVNNAMLKKDIVFIIR